MIEVSSPLQATVWKIEVTPGEFVQADQVLVILESMKMEHLVLAPEAGRVTGVAVEETETVMPGDQLVRIDDAQAPDPEPGSPEAEAAIKERADLAAVVERHDRLTDARRPEAVAKRHQRGHRTARENLADLCDEATFVEYGGFAIAAQTGRRDVEDLIERTSNDSIITGIGHVNDEPAAVMIYDYSVLAGTQGYRTHLKMDRLLRLAHERRLPLVLFAEGGGGRPGDVDVPQVAGLDVPAFALMAQLSGRVPTVGVVSGYCFAGNAVLVGMADVVISTEDSNLGAGGPAMIEGGGLGQFAPTDIGPIDDQVDSGVADIRVADEAEATAVAKQYLSYFQGPIDDWTAPDQTALQAMVPENRKRTYDIRPVIDTLADVGSVLELRSGFGFGMVTALARVEGKPIGILANNPYHLGGAIDVDGADKAARFLTLCDAYGLPVLVLCDTPGIMVGPEAERAGTVRHAARLFVTTSNLSVPVGTIVARKGYGLGAQAMAGGGFKETDFTVAWPTGEFGGMNLEGAVKLGFSKELEAETDPVKRAELEAKLVAAAYDRGSALSMAQVFEIDSVIDPATSRDWIRTLTNHNSGWDWRQGPDRHSFIPTA